MGAEERLAVYGSLAPGRPNHDQLAGLNGDWVPGTVKGILKDEGWGASIGYPGIILDPSGPDVAVQIFQSADLPQHWDRLDAFEGSEYRRAVTDVRTAEGEVQAQIYVVAASDS